jgi:hypothetical protein
VVGSPSDALSARVAELRARGLAATTASDRPAALAWARAWGFTHVLDANDWVDSASGASIAPPLPALAVLAEKRGEK